MKAMIALAAAALTLHAQAQDSAQRFVSGAGVNLRGEASLQGQVIGRLALNERVKLIAKAEGSAFCEVLRQAPDGAEQRGFTACTYLLPTATDVNRLAGRTLPGGKPNPDYDPKRLFWLSPSWPALEAYALLLNETRLPNPDAGEGWQQRRTEFIRDNDEELDRMKAHLAKGVLGAAPPPWVAWDDIQRWAEEMRAPQPESQIPEVLGLYAPLSNLLAPLDQEHVKAAAAAMRSIALPSASPSWFKDGRDIARLDDTTAGLSGRFGIVHTYRTQPRAPVEGGIVAEGLWDIGAHTVALTRAVTRTTLWRDGRMQGATTHASRKQIAWGTEDGLMCWGWAAGFAHGDAEPKLLAAAQDSTWRQDRNQGRLVAFITRQPLPVGRARTATQQIKLDRAASAFVRATQTHFDLDHDGHVDLVAWEAVGRGPGHLDGPTKSDDAWYRLFFVNIAGRWHVLGHDVFSYGCGC
jgi:hypothetical protein